MAQQLADYMTCCICREESYNVFPCCHTGAHFICIYCYARSCPYTFEPGYPVSKVRPARGALPLQKCPLCRAPFLFAQFCPTLIHYIHSQSQPAAAKSAIKLDNPMTMLKQLGLYAECKHCNEGIYVKNVNFGVSSVSRCHPHLAECPKLWFCNCCDETVPKKDREFHHTEHQKLASFVRQRAEEEIVSISDDDDQGETADEEDSEMVAGDDGDDDD